MTSVAVVGAGMAGAACASSLIEAGHQVSVFDKSRGVGGRMAQRRRDGAVFDHGAQFFTARDPAFVAVVRRWLDDGQADRWAIDRPDGDMSYIGTPSMSAPVKALLQGARVTDSVHVNRLFFDAGWTLLDQENRSFGPFDRLALAIPAPQASVLLNTCKATASLSDALEPVVMAPCWTLLLAFREPLDAPGLLGNGTVADDTFAWSTRNATKRDRDGPDAWTLHANATWARKHLERTPAETLDLLKQAFSSLVGCELPESVYEATHRWRYAAVETPLGKPCLSDSSLGIVLVGDWCLGPRIEAAYLSGKAGAQALELSRGRQ